MQRLTPARSRAGGGAKRPPRRKTGKPMPPARRRFIAAAAAAGVALGGYLAWHAGWIEGAARTVNGWAVAATAGIGLTVDEVLLEGRRHAPRATVVKAMGIRRGDAILAVDLDQVRTRIEAIPWVRAARVRRQWPTTVRIAIEERRPIAIWQRKQRLVLVDAEGVAITSKDLRRFRHLLVIVGKDAPSHARDLLAALDGEPALRKQVLAAVRVGSRRWDVRFKSGIEVLMPETNVPAAWARLARLERRHGLLDTDIELIDLRLPDRLIVRTKAPRPRVRPTGGRRT